MGRILLQIGSVEWMIETLKWIAMGLLGIVGGLLIYIWRNKIAEDKIEKDKLTQIHQMLLSIKVKTDKIDNIERDVRKLQIWQAQINTRFKLPDAEEDNQ